MEYHAQSYNMYKRVYLTNLFEMCWSEIGKLLQFDERLRNIYNVQAVFVGHIY